MSASPFDLTDRVVIVTGGARGIGAAYVRALHDAGARVVVADLLEAEGAALAAELGERCRYEWLDVTDEECWAAVVEETVAAWGGLDVLVNNAGIANAGPIEHYPRAKWDAVIAVNLTGVYLGCRAVVGALRSRGGGSIVNISSVEGMRGSTHLHGYVASKFGVRGLTKSLAVELGADRIRVNSIHPGFIETDMTVKIDPSGLPIPLRRGGTPADLTGTMLYLASDASAYVTGAELVVDGGMINGVGHL